MTRLIIAVAAIACFALSAQSTFPPVGATGGGGGAPSGPAGGALTGAYPNPTIPATVTANTACAAGCTINIPALSGRLLYYRVETSANGSTGWINGPMQIAAIK